MEAALRYDPLAALFATWTLCVQMRDFLAVGPGAADLEGVREVALEALAELEAELIEIARTVLTNEDLSPLRGMVEQGAERYPIEGPLHTRASPVIDHADMVVVADRFGEIAASLNQRVADLSRRLALYSAQVPRQARWQAEPLLSGPLQLAAQASDRIATTVELLPALVREEHAALTSLVAEERAQLVAMIAAVGEAVDASPRSARGLIDHLFLRALQLAGVLALAAGVLLALRRVASKRSA